jgi:hypothetical protein
MTFSLGELGEPACPAPVGPHSFLKDFFVEAHLESSVADIHSGELPKANDVQKKSPLNSRPHSNVMPRKKVHAVQVVMPAGFEQRDANLYPFRIWQEGPSEIPVEKLRQRNLESSHHSVTHLECSPRPLQTVLMRQHDVAP